MMFDNFNWINEDFLMRDAESVKVGLLAQAPTGQGGDRIYENLSMESKTVKNIRAGE